MTYNRADWNLGDVALITRPNPRGGGPDAEVRILQRGYNTGREGWQGSVGRLDHDDPAITDAIMLIPAHPTGPQPYRREDWQEGDIAWITPDDTKINRPYNRGRQLRLLAVNSETGAARWRGGLGWLNADPVAHPGLIVTAERAVAVPPDFVNQIGGLDREPNLTTATLTFDNVRVL